MAGLEVGSIRDVRTGQKRIVAVFSYRYDAALVPGLIANIAPAVHDWVAWDDREAGVEMSDEPTRRNRLLSRAVAMGADWILAVDPDERFEWALADRIPGMVEPPGLWTFNLREMFTATAYRTDGLWGGKRQMRLFPAAPALRAAAQGLHGRWIAEGHGLRTFASGLNLYHLRMATPERRRLRRETYAAADPQRRHQKIGYDYLDDERGMQLQEIPPGRDYLPPHVEDGGLWGPDVARIGQVHPDGRGNRLRYLAVLRRQGGARAAVPAALDLHASDPGDEDLACLAAQVLLEAGEPAAAEALIHPFAETGGPLAAMALSLRSRARAAQGERSRAVRDLHIACGEGAG